MSRAISRLTDVQVRKAKAGRYADGGGLYLVVDASGARRWAFLWMRDGKRREMGLGGVASLTLAKARQQSAALRALVQAGLDPLAVRDGEREERRRKAAEAQPFGAFADAWFEESVAPGLSNAKHRDQWRMTLREYCAPIRSKPIAEVATADVLKVLKPIWTTRPETAQRLRGRIERVLDAATVTGARGDSANPARWRGHLDKLLSRQAKLTRGRHAAMPWNEVPAFIKALRERPALAARALEFIVLTASRAGEVLEARWCEIDLDAAVWTVPAARMKARKEHRVPLSAAALALLGGVRPITGGAPDALVFPGRTGRALSLAALEAVRERMGVVGVTTHGFRSSFRDWAGEATNAPREIAEACLAHEIGNAVERAYRRGDALEKRRTLLEQWADFCAGVAHAKVIALSSRTAARDSAA
jgi:integrase